jgi:hypothetical protein
MASSIQGGRCQRNLLVFLTKRIKEESVCTSSEEIDAIVSVIDSDVCDRNLTSLAAIFDSADMNNELFSLLKDSLEEYLGISESGAVTILQNCINQLSGADDAAFDEISNDFENSSLSVASENDTTIIENDDENDDDSVVGKGACELCEREDIKLTRHHMIPKSTYNRIEPKIAKLLQTYLDDANTAKVASRNEVGLEHLIEPVLETIKNLPGSPRNRVFSSLNLSSIEYGKLVQKASRLVIKQQTTNICRPCHSMIHRTHDNLTLATTYNTVEKMLDDAAIYKFCKWCHKQKKSVHSLR